MIKRKCTKKINKNNNLNPVGVYLNMKKRIEKDGELYSIYIFMSFPFLLPLRSAQHRFHTAKRGNKGEREVADKEVTEKSPATGALHPALHSRPR
jgi:hypothetical protein